MMTPKEALSTIDSTEDEVRGSIDSLEISISNRAQKMLDTIEHFVAILTLESMPALDRAEFRDALKTLLCAMPRDFETTVRETCQEFLVVLEMQFRAHRDLMHEIEECYTKVVITSDRDGEKMREMEGQIASAIKIMKVNFNDDVLCWSKSIEDRFEKMRDRTKKMISDVLIDRKRPDDTPPSVLK